MITPAKVLTAVGNGLRRLAGPPVVVLIYHRVIDLAADPQELAVSPKNFAAQVAYLRDNFEVFRFEQDWRPRKRPGVVLTFDDGYFDNCEFALPILEAAGVPATVFVSTGWIGTDRETWWDELERIFLAGQGTTTREPSERLTEAYRAAHRELKALTIDQRNRRLAELRSSWGIPEGGRPTHRALSPDQLGTLSRSPQITLGAHTVNHPQLSALGAEEQEAEILSSRRDLEMRIGKPVEVFSYPYGTRTDYDRHSLAIVQQVGFQKVAANFNGPWFPGCSPWEIPRQLVRNWDAATLSAKMRNFQFV